jgi:hypothetical protein
VEFGIAFDSYLRGSIQDSERPDEGKPAERMGRKATGYAPFGGIR